MTSVPPPTAQALADAAARRHASTEASTSSAQLTQEHEQRQMFRRLIDPGIFRPNPKEIAMGSLSTLSTMAENILREPENPKYHTFKHENDTIKRRLIQPKGALEYALALGFHPKVMDFQSYYVFNPSRMADLRVGAAMLREALDRETQKEERSQRQRSLKTYIKLAFLDDRKSTMMRDERERESRQARESARGSQSASATLVSSPSPDQISRPMPGLGHKLTTVDDELLLD